MRYEKKNLFATLTFAIIIIFILFQFNPTSNRVQKHDLVEIDYQIWESDKYKNYNPLYLLQDQVVLLNVIPITDDPERGLILGLYDNLIGKEKYYESGLIFLNKCIDQNRDGIDDNTGEHALSFGNGTDQYFGMYLLIHFKILSIK